MTAIKITAEQAARLEIIRSAGKTPWLIIDKDAAAVHTTFDSRNAARLQGLELASSCNVAVRVVKADDVELEIIKPVAFAAHVESLGKPADRNHSSSSIVGPVAFVWEAAGRMSKEGATRKEVVDYCVKNGVTLNTARTQYQYWFQARKEELAREATQKSKKA